MNHQELSEEATAVLKELLGKNNVFNSAQLGIEKPQRGGGSDDFSYITQEIHSLMFALVAREPDKVYCYPQRHPKVIFDEDVLSTGATAFSGIAHSRLQE